MITLTETAKLLATASTLDHIQRSRDDVTAWHAVLEHAGVDYAAAHEALVKHFADPDAAREFLKPAHITAQIRAASPSVPLPPRAGEGECDIHDGYPADGCAACARHPEDRGRYLATGERPALVTIGAGQLTAGRTLTGLGSAY